MKKRFTEFTPSSSSIVRGYLDIIEQVAILRRHITDEIDKALCADGVEGDVPFPTLKIGCLGYEMTLALDAPEYYDIFEHALEDLQIVCSDLLKEYLPFEIE